MLFTGNDLRNSAIWSSLWRKNWTHADLISVSSGISVLPGVFATFQCYHYYSAIRRLKILYDLSQDVFQSVFTSFWLSGGKAFSVFATTWANVRYILKVNINWYRSGTWDRGDLFQQWQSSTKSAQLPSLLLAIKWAFTCASNSSLATCLPDV